MMKIIIAIIIKNIPTGITIAMIVPTMLSVFICVVTSDVTRTDVDVKPSSVEVIMVVSVGSE